MVVKRRGHTEDFDVRKLYASIYSACRGVSMSEPDSEMVADKVSREVGFAISKSKLVSSDQIFKLTAHMLNAQNEEVAYMYKHHRDIV